MKGKKVGRKIMLATRLTDGNFLLQQLQFSAFVSILKGLHILSQTTGGARQ